MSRRPTGPSKADIAQYWELGTARAHGERYEFHCDVGEPKCWACGVYSTEHDGDERAHNHADWLERCHLVPHSEGGPFIPSNTVLLCHPCHKDLDRELQNTAGDREAALLWVKTWSSRFAAALDAAVEALKVDKQAVEALDFRLYCTALKEEMSDRDRRSPIQCAQAVQAVVEKLAA